jgi:hypothetical protein
VLTNGKHKTIISKNKQQQQKTNQENEKMTEENNNMDNFDDFESELSQFDDVYAEAPEENEYKELPDGKYRCVVDRAELTKSKSSGQNMLKMAFKVHEGPYAGRLIFKNSMIVTASNVEWLKKDLVCMGLKLARFGELKKRVGELLDTDVSIQQKTKGEHTNHYIQKSFGKLEGGSAGVVSASGAVDAGDGGFGGGGFSGDDDDIPF